MFFSWLCYQLWEQKAECYHCVEEQIWCCPWMYLWKVASWFYHTVFQVAQKVQWSHYQSISHPSRWIMKADPLYVFYTVLSSLISQEDYVLEASVPEARFFLWLNRHPCASHLEPLKKGVLVYFRFLDIGLYIYTTGMFISTAEILHFFIWRFGHR